MRERILRFSLLIFCFYFLGCGEEEPGLTCDDACASIIPFQMNGDFSNGRLTIDLTRDFSSPFINHPSCSPTDIDLAFSIDGSNFQEIDPIPTNNNRIVLDSIEEDENYFFRMTNYHCDLSPVGSKEMMINTNEFVSSELVSQLNFFPLNIYEMSGDQKYIAYVNFSRELYLLDFQGNTPEYRIEHNVTRIKWSNDNTKLAFGGFSSNNRWGIYYYDLVTGETSFLYSYGNTDQIEDLAWSNDDTKIYFLRNDAGAQWIGLDLYEYDIPQRQDKLLKEITSDDFSQATLEVNPLNDDEIYISYTEWDFAGTIQNIYSYSLSQNAIENFLNDHYHDRIRSVSPDGRKLIIETTRAGFFELWVYYVETKKFRRLLQNDQINTIFFTDKMSWISNDEFVFFQSIGFDQTVVVRKLLVE